jgi:hypothetical protein
MTTPPPSERPRAGRARRALAAPRPSRGVARRGQTLVEVALILPIFILTLTAILEFGYWAAVDSAVHTGSREGARFGSTVDDAGGVPNYLNCDEIRAHVRERIGPLVSIPDGQIGIGYDTDGTPGTELTCGSATEAQIARWHRIEVEITHTYEPITPILHAIMGNHAITTTDRRSIVKCDSC